MFIYLITNNINNKKYVGLTIRNPKTRWYEHIKRSKCKNLRVGSLHYDISIFGKESFSFEIIKECSTFLEMCNEEKRYIIEMNSFKDGYNLNSGGKTYEVSFLIRNQMSIESVTSKEVYVYDINGIYINSFRSANEASRKLNIDSRKVFRVLSGKRKSCGGYILSYLYKDNYTSINKYLYKYDMFGNLIYIYKSIGECLNMECVSDGVIRRVLNGKRKHHKGYYYTYDKDSKIPEKRRLYQYSTQDNSIISIYNTIKEASERTGILRSTISKNIGNTRKIKNFYFKWK